MKIDAVIRELKKLKEEHGNLDVMFDDPNNDSIFLVQSINLNVSEGEFPDDWGMPEGFKWINMSNF